MYTRSQIFDQLAAMNAPRDKVVMAHTSLRAVGETEGRGEGFLDALIEYFTADGGLLCIPTHTYAFMKRPVTMEMTSTEICIGTLPSLALARPDGFRSLHPTHSVKVFGDPVKARAYAASDDDSDTSTKPTGCFGRLYDEDGCVLLIGVGHNRDTYLHSVEERLDVPNRLTEALRPARIRLADGSVIERPLHCHSAVGIGDVSARYPKYEPAFRYYGAVTDGFLGDAPTQLCSARKMYDVVKLIRERSEGRELLLDFDPLDEALWMR